MGVPVLPPCLSSAGTVQVWGDSAAESVHSRTAGPGGAVPPSDCRVPEAQWQVPWRLQHLRPWTAPALPGSGTGLGGGVRPLPLESQPCLACSVTLGSHPPWS